MHNNTYLHRRNRLSLLVTLLLTLSACTNIKLDKIVSIENSGPEPYISQSSGAGYVQVYRNGRRLNTRRNMSLEPGDEIATSAHGSATIYFREFGEVILEANTRVRVGSLEVLVGKIFANVRGLFTSYGEGVTLGVEGTKFMFEVQPGRYSRAVVLEGVVRISSDNNQWQPVRVAAGKQFNSKRLDWGGPRIEPANPRELRQISEKIQQVARAPEAGFCCSNGAVEQSFSNQCRGKFFSNRKSAEQGCQQGWCCRNYELNSSMKYQCYGDFHSDYRRAEAACQRPAPPEPRGWCCTHNYSLQRSTEKNCKGRFFSNEKKAQSYCVVY